MRYALGTSVGERGQITIEHEIREKLGIKPKDIAVQHVRDGRLVVDFVRPQEPHMRSLAGILGPSPRRANEPLDIDDAVGKGIAEEWRQAVADEPTGDAGDAGDSGDAATAATAATASKRTTRRSK